MFSGGRGGGGVSKSGCLGVKPPSLNICYRRFIIAFLSFILIAFLVGVQFHFQTKR